MHDLAGLKPQLIHHPLPIMIRRKINHVFMKLAVNRYRADCNATPLIDHKIVSNYRTLRRSPLESHVA